MISDSICFHSIQFIVKRAIKSFKLKYSFHENLTHFRTKNVFLKCITK